MEDVKSNVPATLEDAKKMLLRLTQETESYAWEIGSLLNTVEKTGLAQRYGGDARKWLKADVPEIEAARKSTFYHYMTVARQYTKAHVTQLGSNNLYELMLHEGETGGSATFIEPVEREVHLLQEDGSTLVKKFPDCSVRELRESNRRRRAKHVSSKPKLHSAKSTASSPSVSEDSLTKAVAIGVLGMLMMVVFAVLPLNFFTAWGQLIGLGLFVAAGGMLIKRWHAAIERFFSALLVSLKEGKAPHFLKEQVTKATEGAKRASAAIRARASRKSLPPPRATTETTEVTPPIEKKAA